MNFHTAFSHQNHLRPTRRARFHHFADLVSESSCARNSPLHETSPRAHQGVTPPVCPGRLYDVQKRRVIWTLELPEDDYRIPLGPRTLRGSTAYIFTPHEVLAVDLRDKPEAKDRIRWRFALPEGTRVERIALVGSDVYVLRDDEVLLRLEADSGQLLSEHPLLWDVEMFLVKEETLYGLSSDGQAYAMKLVPIAAAPH